MSGDDLMRLDIAPGSSMSLRLGRIGHNMIEFQICEEPGGVVRAYVALDDKRASDIAAIILRLVGRTR